MIRENLEVESVAIERVMKKGLYHTMLTEVKERDFRNTLMPSRQEDLALHLSSFVLDCIDKYLKGQAEHGGDILQANLEEEKRNELKDLVIYTIAKDFRELTLEELKGLPPRKE